MSIEHVCIFLPVHRINSCLSAPCKRASRPHNHVIQFVHACATSMHCIFPRMDGMRVESTGMYFECTCTYGVPEHAHGASQRACSPACAPMRGYSYIRTYGLFEPTRVAPSHNQVSPPLHACAASIPRDLLRAASVCVECSSHFRMRMCMHVL